MKHRASAGILLYVIRKGLVALVQKKGSQDNPITFPKGKMERGETKKETARRELLEEAGVEIQDLELMCELPKYTRRGLRTGKKRETFMFCYQVDRIPELHDSSHTLYWVEKSSVAQMLTNPDDREYFQRLNLERLVA